MVFLLVALCGLLDDHTVERSVKVGGHLRTYRFHIPPRHDLKNPAPLILAFHGGGSTGEQMEQMCGFSELSDREGFLVVYPDGYERNFNDGRKAQKLKAQREEIDDIGFIEALLRDVEGQVAIDSKRVFATGISNGAIFSHTLAVRLSTRICGIAPVVGGMAPAIAESFKPDHPVSVMVIQGTDDPLVPYEGGAIRGPAGRDAGDHGRIISTAEALKKWIMHNRCEPKEHSEAVEDRDLKDGCRASRTWWEGDATVMLVRVEGGGHTWPGGTQYLGRRWIGRVWQDVDRATFIWEFFKAHPRK